MKEKRKAAQSAQKPVVVSKDSFNEAFEQFAKFEPVKIAKPLKNDFHQFITETLRERGCWFWSAQCEPLQTCYKFRRLKQ